MNSYRKILTVTAIIAGLITSGISITDARTVSRNHSVSAKPHSTQVHSRTNQSARGHSRSNQNVQVHSRSNQNTKIKETQTVPAPSPIRTANGSLVGSAWSLPGKQDGGRNLNRLMSPASTMKVLTAAAALTQLGSGYRFKTSIRTDAKNARKQQSNGIIDGNLIIDFSGDPTFTSEKLVKMFQNLKDSGVRKIKGDIIINSSVFKGYTRGAGWPWEDLTLCFAAPAGGIIIDHNCVITKANLNRGARTFSQPMLTEYQPVKIAFDVEPKPKQDIADGSCPLIVEPSIDNTYRVTGCFNEELNRRRNYLQNFKFAVQDPKLWAKDIIRLAMRKVGISYTGKIDFSSRPVDGFTVLDTSVSAELPVMVKHMLKFSDNLYAEAIAAAAARSYLKKPVTIYSAAQGVKGILKEKAGIQFAGADLYDGSGLSSYNLITVSTMLQVLKYIKNNDSRLHILDLLPVSGESGTMLKRASVIKPPLKGNIIAKTGTIRHVRNLAGYVKTVNNNLVPFVVFTNDYSPDTAEYKLMNDENKLLPHFEYERNLLEYLREEKTPVFRQ